MESSAADLSKVWNRLTRLPPPVSFATVPGLEIWFANLAPLLPLADPFSVLLDADERAEVARLRHPDDQARMIVRRGLWRWLLAGRLSCPPEQLRFGRGPWNKPFICSPAEGTALCFNASSAAGWFLLVMANSAELGCDVESLSRLTWSPGLSDSVCSAAERAQLAALSATERPRAFLRLWTAKEAVLKLRGGGLRETADIATLLEHLRADEKVAELAADPDVVIHLAVRV